MGKFKKFIIMVFVVLFYITIVEYFNQEKINGFLDSSSNLISKKIAPQENQHDLLEKNKKLEVLYKKAITHIDAKNFESAIPLLKQLLTLNPDDKKIHDLHIKTLIQNANFETAYEYIKLCGYEKCYEFADLLHDKVKEFTIGHGLEMKNLPILIALYNLYEIRPDSFANHNAFNDPLCSKTNIIASRYDFFSDEDRLNFIRWIDEHNPGDFEEGSQKNETIAALIKENSTLNDHNNRVFDRKSMVTITSVLSDVKNGAISLAHHITQRIADDAFYFPSCVDLNLAAADETYFALAYEGVLQLFNDRYLNFDTSNQVARHSFGTYLDNLFQYYLLKILFEDCIKAGECKTKIY